MSFYLASASPRRHELLTQIGVRFDVVNVDVDETPLAKESPEDYVQRVALAKAQAGLKTLGDDPEVVVLGGDTSVICNGQVFGKPENQAHALEMLMALSGAEHEVYSAISVVSAARQTTRLVKTTVRFRDLSEQECEAYWQTGEPQGKAGGYAIQGLGSVFVASIEGSYTGVVGLPVAETAQLLADFDVPVWAC
jgi:nucleoside triphosphate pyrophosphatase